MDSTFTVNLGKKFIYIYFLGLQIIINFAYDKIKAKRIILSFLSYPNYLFFLMKANYLLLSYIVLKEP